MGERRRGPLDRLQYLRAHLLAHVVPNALTSSQGSAGAHRTDARMVSTSASSSPWQQFDLPRATEAQLREYMASLLPSAAECEAWISSETADRFTHGRPDPDLGYIERERVLADGAPLDAGGGGRAGGTPSICSYTFGRWGERTTIRHADQPCRINTYGDSFTACNQGSDGQTWQEVLAARLLEPVRNFGVGGFSVYQAYRRMLREEELIPADHIIFNIFDDDHFRSLGGPNGGWCAFRHGGTVHESSFSTTKPSVMLYTNRSGELELVERDNPCPGLVEMIASLTDLDAALELFRDDVAFHAAACGEYEARREHAGLRSYALHTTMGIIEKIEQWAKAKGKSVLYVLSYWDFTCKEYLERGTRFDAELVDWIRAKGLPCVDLMEAHRKEYERYFACSVDDYTDRYWHGHYSPNGNAFCASTLLPHVLNQLRASGMPALCENLTMKHSPVGGAVELTRQ